MRIGLLGGSFNPPHKGHIHISCEAKKALSLDAVWWLVTPQNPLKTKVRDINSRMEECYQITESHSFIEVRDEESKLPTNLSADTVEHLQDIYEHEFIWVMGADNLSDFDKWEKMDKLMQLIKVAIFTRPNYLKDSSILQNKQSNIASFLAADAPAWIYIECAEMDISSTQLRAEQEAESSL